MLLRVQPGMNQAHLAVAVAEVTVFVNEVAVIAGVILGVVCFIPNPRAILSDGCRETDGLPRVKGGFRAFPRHIRSNDFRIVGCIKLDAAISATHFVVLFFDEFMFPSRHD